MAKTTQKKLAAFVVALLALPHGLRAEVKESFDLDTYEVDQEEGETLLQAINDVSPIRERGRIFHGYTKWFIKWNFRWWEEANGSCRITEVSTSLDVAMTMPVLDEATPEVAAVFRQYSKSLRAHEDGHRDIALNAAAKIDAGIRTLAPMPSCQALSRAANQLGHAVLNEARTIERQYDVSTEHGCTQGACLRKY